MRARMPGLRLHASLLRPTRWQRLRKFLGFPKLPTKLVLTLIKPISPDDCDFCWGVNSLEDDYCRCCGGFIPGVLSG